MIRFSCPVCKMMMEAPDDRAGSKVACLQCQQTLVIPPPPRTVLATGPGQPTPKPFLSSFTVAGVFLGVASLPLALFVVPVYVGVGVAILAAGLAVVGTFLSLRGEGGGVGFAVSILLLCASALFTGYGSFTLNERQATNRGLIEQAEALKTDAAKTLEEAREREAKAERAPKRAQELLRKAVEAEERAQEAPAKAQIRLEKAEQVRAQAISEPLKLKAEAEATLEKARATLEKAKAERSLADQANEKAVRALEQAKAKAEEGERKANLLLKEASTKQQEAGELHKKAEAERAKSQALLKEALDKNKQTEETHKKTQALLDGAVMTLKSDKEEVRLKAATGLVRLNVRIAEASRALCEVAVFGALRHRKEQALRLLEKARPELHKPVVTLARPSTDQSAGHITAVQAIARLGPDGNAATTVVLRQLQTSAAYVQKTGSDGYALALAKTCLAALVKIAPEEVEVTRAMAGIAQTRAEARNRALDDLRIDTLLTLRGITTGNPKTARRLVPCFVAAVNDENTSIRLLGIEALGRIGQEAKEAVPTLRGLRNADEITPVPNFF
ncbi:MAG: hypothetical protein L0Z62_50940, partial [Gemmataceae bacterium]|nr:hypothetical protein [Gemmataceae bacterium]